MSTVASRIPRHEALVDADAFRGLFIGTFERWQYAGSIRRLRDDVGDIEHVVIPSRLERDTGDLFGTRELFNALRGRAEGLIDEGVLALHNYGAADEDRHRFGDRYFGVDFRGRLHEVFMCDEDNWGLILAIRTGSADFSRGLMVRLLKRGYQSIGGRLFMKGLGGLLEPRKTPHEDDVLHGAGLHVEDFPPEKREVAP